MLAILNFLMQGVGIIAGVYIAITSSWSDGLILCAIILLGHVLFTKLSNGTMWLHQKLFLNEEDLRSMATYANLGMPSMVQVPAAWRIIAVFFGIAYLALATLAIFVFLRQADAI